MITVKKNVGADDEHDERKTQNCCYRFMVRVGVNALPDRYAVGQTLKW